LDGIAVDGQVVEGADTGDTGIGYDVTESWRQTATLTQRSKGYDELSAMYAGRLILEASTGQE